MLNWTLFLWWSPVFTLNSLESAQGKVPMCHESEYVEFHGLVVELGTVEPAAGDRFTACAPLTWIKKSLRWLQGHSDHALYQSGGLVYWDIHPQAPKRSWRRGKSIATSSRWLVWMHVQQLAGKRGGSSLVWNPVGPQFFRLIFI